jgi:hypothetical protein
VGVLAVMHLKGENNLAQEESKEGGRYEKYISKVRKSKFNM